MVINYFENQTVFWFFVRFTFDSNVYHSKHCLKYYWLGKWHINTHKWSSPLPSMKCINDLYLNMEKFSKLKKQKKEVRYWHNSHYELSVFSHAAKRNCARTVKIVCKWVPSKFFKRFQVSLHYTNAVYVYNELK